MADISIIIPAYNEEDYLADTLASLHEAIADIPFSVEIVVVDNNSTDRTADIAIDMGARVVFEPVNQISRARNAGGRAAAGRFLIFVDADTTLQPVLIKQALVNMASGRIAGGGSPFAPDRPLEPAARKGLEFWNGFSQRFNIAAGSFVYCTREAFSAVGGFSERVYASEEIWFSINMHRWARRHGKRFVVIRDWPVVTSVRKLDWFSQARLILSVLVLIVFPFAPFSKRLCYLWYYRPKS